MYQGKHLTDHMHYNNQKHTIYTDTDIVNKKISLIYNYFTFKVIYFNDYGFKLKNVPLKQTKKQKMNKIHYIR